MEDTYNKNPSPPSSFLNDLIYIEDDALSAETCVKLVNYMDSNLAIDTTPPLNISVQNAHTMYVEVDKLCGECGYELNNIIKITLQKYLGSNQIVLNYFKLYSDYIISDYPIFHMLKYKQNIEQFDYHNDFRIEDDKFRILTFLWYLNDVDSGGETEFFGEIKIKPKRGRLLVFPCAWPYIHKGNIPLSSDKYVITGWVYIKNMFQ
jgi:hypothetical protein